MYEKMKEFIHILPAAAEGFLILQPKGKRKIVAGFSFCVKMVHSRQKEKGCIF